MRVTQSVHSVSRTQKLIEGLQRIIATNLELALVPIANNKQPIGDRWQQRPFTATQLSAALSQGGVEVPIQNQTQKIQPLGFGLITGLSLTVRGFTYYVMALDQDGASARRKIDELSGGESLPKTVAFTSGRSGRCQYLFLIPEQYKNAIKTKKIKTGVLGDDGKAEQLEFRWANLQSVLPPSVHPTTGEYRWVEGCAIDETEIALAPDWIIEQMLIEGVGNRQSGIGRSTPFPTHNSPIPRSDIDYALSYLNALSPFRADDYDQWLTVGMALHSVDDSLVDEWDSWSSQSAKYKSGDCHQKWRSFSAGGGVKLGTLAHMAKQDGWQLPFSNCSQFTSYYPQSNPQLRARNHQAAENKSNHRGEDSLNMNQIGDPVKIRELLLKILEQNLSAAELTEALNQLSASWGWSVRELRTLLEQIESDLERQENQNRSHW